MVSQEASLNDRVATLRVTNTNKNGYLKAKSKKIVKRMILKLSILKTKIKISIMKPVLRKNDLQPTLINTKTKNTQRSHMKEEMLDKMNRTTSNRQTLMLAAINSKVGVEAEVITEEAIEEEEAAVRIITTREIRSKTFLSKERLKGNNLRGIIVRDRN